AHTAVTCLALGMRNVHGIIVSRSTFRCKRAEGEAPESGPAEPRRYPIKNALRHRVFRNTSQRMKQVLRKGLKDIIVDEVPDPIVTPHHILVRPCFSLISSGTETASLHQEGILKTVA